MWSLHVAYDDTVPYVANVSLSVQFRQDREDASESRSRQSAELSAVG